MEIQKRKGRAAAAAGGIHGGRGRAPSRGGPEVNRSGPRGILTTTGQQKGAATQGCATCYYEKTVLPNLLNLRTAAPNRKWGVHLPYRCTSQRSHTSTAQNREPSKRDNIRSRRCLRRMAGWTSGKMMRAMVSIAEVGWRRWLFGGR